MINDRFKKWLREYVASAECRGLDHDALWQRVSQQNDEYAFRVFVEELGPRVYQVCRGILFDRHFAEDACQEVFLRLAKRRTSIRDYDQARRWILTAAVYVSHEIRRARRRIAAREQVHYQNQTSPDATPTVPDDVDRLAAAVAQLPETYRRPLELIYWENQSYEEAAQKLGITKEAVYIRVSRGLTRLRSKLGLAATVPVATLLANPAPALPASVMQALMGPLPSAAAGWGTAKLLALGIMLTVTGVTTASWLIDSEPKPPVVAVATPPPKPPSPPLPALNRPVVLAQRHRQMFEQHVRAKLQTALDHLQIGAGGRSTITAIQTLPTRVILEAKIQHGIPVTSRLWIAFDVHTRHCVVLADHLGTGVYAPIEGGDRVIIGSPERGYRFAIPQLTHVLAALQELPPDPRTRDVTNRERATLQPLLETMAGEWKRVVGPPGRWSITVRRGPEADGIPLWIRWGRGYTEGSLIPWTCIWPLPDGRVAMRRIDERGTVVRSADGRQLLGPNGEIWEKVSTD